ncbi:putative toxin-antitoxin system toxin component, PIN family [Thiomonas arsenitoxydans]|jgi:putative PIN family toxin of toxin-antitoxin system|uniref:putative toxin-antitoxin system toxin component, PIN family n=1 Tax=Thiomonas arsenitoxydans (strain DSM 22701 / CIP 110005 / 3As) TaxID=426114 RepID=UPI001AC8E220|nr:putative toxin-antitoxin system toxin component, PIN family [Thiomonas arsenitoxydans]MBN8775250.1 putative toxin-antitoxin system toxin component, PIN family [Thiomonas arsenitoxydans]
MKVERDSRRFVIDTNVWISAALSPPGAPAQVVRRVLQHGLVVLTTHTFAELETRLWKPKFDPYLSIEVRQQLLHDLSAAAIWVDVPPGLAAQTFSRDPDDDAFIHAAEVAQALWLVTGDQDLLGVNPPPIGLRILTPAQALQHPEFA